MQNSAVFLDRDGVIIRDSANYIKSVDEVVILNGVFDAIRKLNEVKFKVIIVTNQSAINRGKTTRQNVEAIHKYLQEQCRKNNCHIDSFYFCPHRPDENCNCRKPKKGMFLKAARENSIDLTSSWMIGDKESDVIAGKSAGCKTIKIKTNTSKINEVVKKILVDRVIHQAVILAGGLGTRLGDITKKTPKPMVLIKNKPFIQYQIDLLKIARFNNIVICVGFLAEQIIQYFENSHHPGVKIKFSIEKDPLGTGGALKNSLRFLDDEFTILNGDTFLKLNFDMVLQFHKNSNADMTMVITKVLDGSRFGKVTIDKKNKITGFYNNRSKKGFVNAGIYVVKKRSINWKDLPSKFSLEKDFLPNFIKQKNVYGYTYEGDFIDIGTPVSLEQFKDKITSGH